MPDGPYACAAGCLPERGGPLSARSIEWYFTRAYPSGGRYDLPVIRRQSVALDNLKLIRFSSIVRDETRDLDATVHFFEPDERFDEVWKHPERYLCELGQYRQVLSPDFSLFLDMPISLQILNTFRSRWCAWWWQEHGLTVIPTVSWIITMRGDSIRVISVRRSRKEEEAHYAREGMD